MSEIRERAKIAAKEMKLTGWDRWAATVKDLLAELERVEGNRESECMECEKLACIEIRQQAARDCVEFVTGMAVFPYRQTLLGVAASIKDHFGLEAQ